MRTVLMICLSSVVLFSAAEKHYEQSEMTPIRTASWIYLLGSWDTEGRPFIKEMTFTTKYNRNAFGEHFYGNQIHVIDTKGVDRYFGITVSCE